MTIETTTLCSECWSEHSKSDLINIDGKMVCGACKDRHLQRLHEGVPSSNVMEYAGFWIRLVAKILDSLIIGSTFAAIIFLHLALIGGFKLTITPEEMQSMDKSVGLLFIFLWLLGAFHPVYFLGKYAATPGKMLLGLKVIRSNGEQVTYLRAFCRLLSEGLNNMIFCIGYIMAGFTEEKTSLHDIICDTRVIKK